MSEDQEKKNELENVIPFSKDKVKQFIEEEGGEDLLAFLLDDGGKLDEMNEKHAFINSVSGKPMVMCHVISPLANRKVIEFRTPDAIITQYSNQSVQIGKTVIDLGKWWIRHTKRREYETVIFDPSKGKEWEGCYNLWGGITVEPKKGCWKHSLKHLYKILCNKDQAKFKYLIKWLAWLVQNPGERAEVAVIFKGKEGAGKGFIFSQFLKIYGQHGIAISNRQHLTGQFNGHLRQVVFLFADEAYYPGDKEVEGTLKQLITEEQIPIRDLYKTLGPSKNCLHIGMSTNQEWIIPAGEDSRRYFINEVDNCYAKNQTLNHLREEYFDKLWKEMDNGGREAMMYDLQNMDLHHWHPRNNVPMTEEMTKQRLLSLPKIHKLFLSFIEDGIFPGELNRELEYIVSAKVLYDYLEEIEPDSKRYSSRMKSDFIKKLGAKKIRRSTGNHWKFLTLRETRVNWNNNYGTYDWNDPIEEWIVKQTSY